MNINGCIAFLVVLKWICQQNRFNEFAPYMLIPRGVFWAKTEWAYNHNAYSIADAFLSTIECGINSCVMFSLLPFLHFELLIRRLWQTMVNEEWAGKQEQWGTSKENDDVEKKILHWYLLPLSARIQIPRCPFSAAPQSSHQLYGCCGRYDQSVTSAIHINQWPLLPELCPLS